MITYNVKSNVKPAKLSYYSHGAKAEVYIRTEPTTEIDDDGNELFVYDEVMFETSETESDINKNVDAFFDFGKAWSGSEPVSQAQIISDLKSKTDQNTADIAYIAMMNGIEM